MFVSLWIGTKEVRENHLQIPPIMHVHESIVWVACSVMFCLMCVSKTWAENGSVLQFNGKFGNESNCRFDVFVYGNGWCALIRLTDCL